MNKELEEAIERIKYLLTDDCDCESCKKDKKAYKTVLKELERLQEENKRLNIVILKDYISKFAVREKLEDLQKQYKEALEENSTKAFILKCQIEILKELLEGK